MAEPTVRMSGIVLASLMFQHVNSDSDVEGLLLGESRFEEQVTISDSQADQIHIEETYITCFLIYLNRRPETHRLLQTQPVNNKQESVIGWYRQRRNTDQQMTFREKVVHEKLKASLSNPHMIFVLLTPSKLTPAGSTHRTEYAAFTSRSRRFLNVPILVNNLGLLEQLAYCKVSAPSAGEQRCVHMFLTSCCFTHTHTHSCLYFCVCVCGGQKACSEVEESERLVETLQVEVSALRRRLREKKRNGAENEPDEEPAEQKKNLRLHEAVRALFSCSPLFHTQTLNLEGFPVPDVCCGPEREAHNNPTSDESQETLCEPLNPGRRPSVKRPKEMLSFIRRFDPKRRTSESEERRQRQEVKTNSFKSELKTLPK
uniref:Abraxas 1, BRCA1 A complex subunit n=1 Tax=Labrus bergylta TaxID=56723 RepID=A0A3Q3MVI5_9LABR